jgi:cyclic beta-1,2-glucan synthetase
VYSLAGRLIFRAVATAIPPVTKRPPLKRFLAWFRQNGHGEELVGPIRGEVLGVDRLAERARAVARQQRQLPPERHRGPGPLLLRLDDTRRVLSDVEQRLGSAAGRDVDISSAGEWLLDNYYIVQEHIREIRMSLPKQYYQELPKLANGKLRGYPRVYELAIELIAHTEGRLDLENITLFTQEYQRVAPLRLGELWAIPTMLRLGLVENIRRMALRTMARLQEVESADKWANRLREASEQSPEALTKALSAFIDTHPPLTPTFVARFLSQIRSYQTNFTPLVWLEQWIAEDGPSAEESVTRSNRRVALTQVTVTNSIMSLRAIARLDWNEFVEAQSAVEKLLRDDPAGAYVAMTFESRDAYRHVVERIAKRTEREETEVAAAALALAREPGAGPRSSHIGYWLVDSGRAELEQRVGYVPPFGERWYRWVLRHPNVVYFGSILTLTLLVFLMVNSLVTITSAWISALLAVVLLVPSSEVAVAIVNQLVTLWVPPRTLPKLDFHETGLPEEYKTVVVVPTLFGNVSAVREALEHLEVQYLANRDTNLRFAILSDFTDAKTETTPGDAQIVDAAERGIQALNEQYRGKSGDTFFLFHRQRKWNPGQSAWMGWERKRGKLAQFNRFLRGQESGAFSSIVGDAAPLRGTRYVITLDSDTVLPRSSAHEMAGAMAHPLNHPEYDPARGRVVRGYGIMQPRVGITLTSAHRSKFAAIHSGHPGVDPYTTAVSDVYQDLYGEGSFTGKGIYDVDAFEEATHGRFPENTLLSHDLIEGTYSRAGLLTDVELYDEYPTRYLAYTRRKHRWIRGDWQIVRWLRATVPGPDGMEPNRLSAVSRWKIFDNLRRSLVEISQLSLILLGWFLLPGSPLAWTVVALLFIAFPWLFSTLLALVTPPSDQSWKAYYSAVWDDVIANALQLALAVTFLPHQAVVSADAIIRTTVRKTITRRNLLEWQTASQVERAMKSGADREIYRRMWPATAIGIAVIVVWIARMTLFAPPAGVDVSVWATAFALVAMLPLCLIWIVSPSIAAALSAPAIPGEVRLSEKERATALRYAKLHWEFYTTFMQDDLYGLVPDNFQEDPEPEIAKRTSPTNIGLQLMAIVSAADLGFISRAEMINRLERVFRSLERMQRYRGHFYNWYDLQTLQPLEPAYISTVDSGNLAGHLIALKQACVQIIHELQPRTAEIETPGKSLAGGILAAAPDERLKGRVAPGEDVGDECARLGAIADRAFAYATEMDFTFLFDDRRKLFSIGFHTSANTFDNSFYDLLASEARLASFVAIAKGDVPVEHWFRLGRSLTPVVGTRVLISWSGSMFEYLMPVLVTQSYPFTLLDQTYRGAVRRQISYGAERRVPWGVSESAYNVRDRSQTYQYRAFGVPDLALKRGMSKDLVIAPYATVLAMLIEPRQALRNLTVLEAEGALGPYGFRDAIDYTRPAQESDKAVVGTYMAHHIGMSIVALTNTLQRQIWQRRFHADPLVRSNELVLHERIPRRLIVQDTAGNDEVVHRVPVETTKPAVREIDTPHTPQPRVALLGNVPYTTMITNAGGGYSRYADMVVTRWRRDTTRDNHGEWVYVKDIKSGRVWSGAHQPVAVDADWYQVLFASDRVEFLRRDGDIETQMEVVVSSDDAAEVRRITILNRSSVVRDIELTSYAEIVLQSLDADRQHPAYGNLFVQTEWVEANSGILATRRPKSNDEKTYWAAHVVAVGPERVGEIMYETDRQRFIGRGKSVRHPAALEEGGTLTNTVGAPLDPIFSLRVRLRVQPGKSAQVSFTTFVAESRERALELIDLYDDPFSAGRALNLSWAQAQAELRDLGIAPADAALYQQLAGYLIYPHPRLRPTGAEMRSSSQGQQALWALGLSGDWPILLATIDAKGGIPSVRQLLQAHQYWRIKGLMCDLVILNEHPPSYLQELNDSIMGTILASGESGLIDRPGGVFLRRADVLKPEDVALLRAMARVHVACDGLGLGTLLEFPDGDAEYAGRPEAPVPPRYARRITGPRATTLPADSPATNGYGFFNDVGEYELQLHGTGLPPAPWSNVVANPRGGFVITESGSSCTWMENSYFYRLTPWHNDPVRDPCSDCMYLRDDENGDVWTATPAPIREMSAYVIKHGLGYSSFEHEHGQIRTMLHVSMALNDPVKITTLRVTNTGTTKRRLTITSYVEWVLGVSRDLTQQYVRTSFDQETQSLFGQNFFDQQYANQVGFLAMTGPIQSYTGDRREFIGRNGTPARPAALSKTMLGEMVGEMVDPCGALQTVITLEPGESKDVVVLLGAHDSIEHARELVQRYCDVQRAGAEVDRSLGSWHNRLTTIQLRTPEPTFDSLANKWLLYQALSCRMWGRAALYQSSGAYGFRDQLQDVMAFVYTDPELAREHILRAARRQFVEGDVQHWWHPQSGRGVRTRFSDDLAWLAYVVCQYVQVSGDTGILDEQVPYITMRLLEPHEHEIYDLPQESDQIGTIYDHCVRALRKACTFGAHDLPLIGSGDWNDGFSRVGIEGKGESVWLAWFLIATIQRTLPYCTARGDTATHDHLAEFVQRYTKAVDAQAWDGDWYRRAYFDDGSPLGSKESQEAKIDSIAQSWSVISAAGDATRRERAMQSAGEHLVREDARLIMLLTPPFDKSPRDPGYIKGYLPGVRENGAQYTHAALWLVLATALQGKGTRAFELFQMLNPITHTQTPDAVERYKVEPYVVAADVYTAEGHLGRGGWTWYTGSASWMYRVALEAILGFEKRGDVLIVNPCIPAAWDSYSIEYRHRSAHYTITVKNPAHVEHGVQSVTVNDVESSNQAIPLTDDGQHHVVVVTLG